MWTPLDWGRKMSHILKSEGPKSIHLLGRSCPEKPPAVPDGNAIGAGGVCSDLTEHRWTRGAAQCTWQGAGTQTVGGKKVEEGNEKERRACGTTCKVGSGRNKTATVVNTAAPITSKESRASCWQEMCAAASGDIPASPGAAAAV